MLLADPVADPIPRPEAFPAGAAAQQRRVERRQHRKLEQEIRDALRQEALVLHYQPRCRLADCAATGAEALVRWPHRPRGTNSPAFSIPVTEQSELIVEIGGWILRRACAEAAAWQDPDAVVSVNIAARQMRGFALLEQVAMALEESGLPPERLELELAEPMLIEERDDTLLALSALRDLGLRIALDHFGLGLSSLSVLRQLPFTTVKLDRSIIAAVNEEGEEAAMVAALVATGHALGLEVIAEGIETETQRRFLAALGCDEGQGFLFSSAIRHAPLSRPR